jgi:Uma2 family endonuclease
VPLLEPGDHLDQATFHARYTAMPEDFKAELIGGVVYMPTALRRAHGRATSLIVHWLRAYEDATPGVEVYDNATTILGDESEPQPDASLIVQPECGGQMRVTDDDYLQGAPELVAEVAYSTEAYDLHSKKRDYERAGVREYLVVTLRQRKVFWFVNRGGRFEERPPDADGLLRSEGFPGLWLDSGSDDRAGRSASARGLATGFSFTRPRCVCRPTGGAVCRQRRRSRALGSANESVSCFAKGVGSRSREPSGTELGHACPLETSPARLAGPTESLPENDSRPLPPVLLRNT